ncbi:MAG: methylmalonyl-CoA mutase family protein [Bacteroidales bacterium]
MAYDKLFTEFPDVETQQWEDAIEKDLKGADYNKKLIWKTIEGFEVRPYYRATDLQGLEYLENNPNEKPFVRGYQSAGNDWEIRMDLDTDDLKVQNTIALDCLARGVNSIGFNAKNVHNQEDLNILLNGIYLDYIRINFLKSRNFLNLLQLFVSYCKANGIDTQKVKGSVNFDSYFYALKHGKFWGSNAENMDEAAMIMRYAKENLPLFKTITINGKIFSNAGSNISQELGFSLAIANEYLYNMTQRGISAEDCVERMMFSFATGSTYFMEIAKIRATRLLWSNIAEQYSKDEKAARIFIHTEDTKYNKTVFDAYVNMLRTTTETMSAVVGGADSIAVMPFDVAFKPSDEFSRRIALNQQILLKEESYLDKIIDPSAGSYYIETLTDNIAQRAWSLFQEVEKQGGYEQSIRNNFVQQTVVDTEQLRAKNVAKRKTVIVGTNQYPNITEKEVRIEHNECCSCCHQEEREFDALRCTRAAKPFEKLRIAVINSEKKPKVFNLLYGNLAMRNARQGFSTNFFGVAGYDIVSKPTDDIVKGCEDALKENPDILVLCSSDDEYPEFVKAALPVVKGKIKHIIVAGNPEDGLKEEFNAMGVTDYINVRTNALDSLTKYNDDLLN